MIQVVPLGVDLLKVGVAVAIAAPKIYSTGKAIAAVVDAKKEKNKDEKK
jgi:hypothetical protein